ncbi:MAG: sigma-70 family RNA polymerase sigma factor [Planctomycetota bacterium]
MERRNATPDELLAHAQWLKRLARSLSRDEASADDLVQQTWARAIASGAPRDGLGAWLRRALERIARHGRRGDVRRSERERIAARGVQDRDDDALSESFELQQKLAQLVDELPEPQRTLVLLRYYEGLTAAEISRRRGAPAATVRSQLARARATLRDRWVEADERGHSRSLASIALIAGTSPEVIGAGVTMKLTHAVALASAVALLLVAGFHFGAGVGPDERDAGRADDVAAVLVRPESATEEDDAVRLPQQSTDRVAEAPVAADPPVPVVAEEPPPTRLLMRAVNESGRPLEGATLLDSSADPAVSSTSAADGWLVLAVDPERIRLWRGRPVAMPFVVSCDGQATRFLDIALPRDIDTDLGDLKLAPGGAVAGRVVDESGHGLRDVEVMVGAAALGGPLELARRLGPQDERPWLEARTAADGSFRLAGVPIDGARVWARRDGWPWGVSAVVTLRPGSEERIDDIVLAPADPAMLIVGTVVTPDGRPRAGAKVVARGLSEGLLRYEIDESDEQGRFALLAFDAGPHLVGAFDPSEEFSPSVAGRVSPGASDARLELTPMRWCTATLVDAKTGAPVERPWVHIDVSGGLGDAPGVSDSCQETAGPGQVRFTVPAAEFRIAASGKAAARKEVGPFRRETLDEEIEIRLERKAMIEGRVTAGGEPLEGATVRTMRDLTGQFAIETEGFPTRLFDGGAFAATTDEQGRFSHPVSTALPRGPHVVHASMEGWASAELVVEIDAEGAEGIELELTPGGTLTGRVLLPEGEDPRNGKVAASNGDGSVSTTRVGAEGEYVLEHLASGPWQVAYRDGTEEFFQAFGAEPPKGGFEGDCEVVEGRTTRHDLDLRTETRTIAGSLAIDGVPASGWSARLLNIGIAFGSEVEGSSLLDAGGVYSVVVEDDEATLALEAPDGAPRFMRFTRRVSETDFGRVDVDLDVPTGRLRGRAAAGSRLRLHGSLPVDEPGSDPWGFRFDIEVDDGGRFDLLVPATLVKVYVETSKAGKFTRFVESTQVAVPAGGEASVEVEPGD